MAAAPTTALRHVRGEWLDRAASIGLCARGAVYVVFGLICASLARGDLSGEASSRGAIEELSERSFGAALLLLVAAGLLLYAIACALGAIRGYGGKRAGQSSAKDRALDAARTVINAALAALAIQVLVDRSGAASSQPNQREQHVTARILELPGGRLLVGVVGLAVIAAGLAQLRKTVTRSFTRGLDLQALADPLQRRIEWLGVVGYAARAVVLGLVGWFLVRAAIDHQPGDAVGIDGALRRLVDDPYGPPVLLLVAIGMIAFGCWSFVEARFRRATG